MSSTDSAAIGHLRDQLTSRLAAEALVSLNGRIGLSWPLPNANIEPRERIAFEVSDGQLAWLEDDAIVDATFYFSRRELVPAVLCGRTDPIGAFMAGEFCSSGYLLWTFPLLSLFRAPLHAPPSSSPQGGEEVVDQPA